MIHLGFLLSQDGWGNGNAGETGEVEACKRERERSPLSPSRSPPHFLHATFQGASEVTPLFNTPGGAESIAIPMDLRSRCGTSEQARSTRTVDGQQVTRYDASGESLQLDVVHSPELVVPYDCELQ